MSPSPNWLPPLVRFEDFNGDWERYLEALYAWFKRDFIDSTPLFQNRRLGLKRHPLTHGKEATFWHFIQEGAVEDERTPDLRRCERIRWPRPVIEHSDDPEIKFWCNERRGEKRVCLWFVRENYLVILADREEYILPWTAYLVDQPHRIRKLQKEHDAWWRDRAQKS